MRVGVASLGTFLFILFLVLVNMGLSSEKVDKLFDDIEEGAFRDVNYSTDANLSNFISYTGQGIVKEFHGGYYLAAFVNPFLPAWFVENAELLAIIAIIALAAPIIAEVVKFGLLIVLALFMLIWEFVKKRKLKSRKKKLEAGLE